MLHDVQTQVSIATGWNGVQQVEVQITKKPSLRYCACAFLSSAWFVQNKGVVEQDQHTDRQRHRQKGFADKGATCCKSDLCYLLRVATRHHRNTSCYSRCITPSWCFSVCSLQSTYMQACGDEHPSNVAVSSQPTHPCLNSTAAKHTPTSALPSCTQYL